MDIGSYTRRTHRCTMSLTPKAISNLEDGLQNPCFYSAEASCAACGHSVPAATIRRAKLGSLPAGHPELKAIGNGACFGQWKGDEGARKWLTAPLPKGFQPRRQLLAAMGCVTGLQFDPGFAGRFHTVWEKSYWPCKERCMSDSTCARSYYETKQWPCKADALRAHDEAVGLRDAGGALALNATPPYLMHHFYGRSVRLSRRALADRRDPPRLLHARALRQALWQSCRRPGRVRQLAGGGREACVRRHGRWRCAIHFGSWGRRSRTSSSTATS